MHPQGTSPLRGPHRVTHHGEFSAVGFDAGGGVVPGGGGVGATGVLRKYRVFQLFGGVTPRVL